MSLSFIFYLKKKLIFNRFTTSKYLPNGWWATFKLHKPSRTNDIHYLDIRAYNLHKILHKVTVQVQEESKIKTKNKTKTKNLVKFVIQ